MVASRPVRLGLLDQCPDVARRQVLSGAKLGVRNRDNCSIYTNSRAAGMRLVPGRANLSLASRRRFCAGRVERRCWARPAFRHRRFGVTFGRHAVTLRLSCSTMSVSRLASGYRRTPRRCLGLGRGRMLATEGALTGVESDRHWTQLRCPTPAGIEFTTGGEFDRFGAMPKSPI
jgi:hypothetical protein